MHDPLLSLCVQSNSLYLVWKLEDAQSTIASRFIFFHAVHFLCSYDDRRRQLINSIIICEMPLVSSNMLL